MGEDAPHCLDARGAGQGDVHHHDLRLQTAEQRVRRGRILGFAHDLDVGLPLEQPAVALAHDRVVVHEQHAQMSVASGHDAPGGRIGLSPAPTLDTSNGGAGGNRTPVHKSYASRSTYVATVYCSRRSLPDGQGKRAANPVTIRGIHPRYVYSAS
jgi:hypothetical protein